MRAIALSLLLVLSAAEARAGIICNALATKESCEAAEIRAQIVDAILKRDQKRKEAREEEIRRRCIPIVTVDEQGQRHEMLTAENCSR